MIGSCTNKRFLLSEQGSQWLQEKQNGREKERELSYRANSAEKANTDTHSASKPLNLIPKPQPTLHHQDTEKHIIGQNTVFFKLIKKKNKANYVSHNTKHINRTSFIKCNFKSDVSAK